MNCERGDLVEVTTADGGAVRMRALGGPTSGRDFTVIWVCAESEWSVAQELSDLEALERHGIPWPSEHVRLLAHA